MPMLNVVEWSRGHLTQCKGSNHHAQLQLIVMILVHLNAGKCPGAKVWVNAFYTSFFYLLSNSNHFDFIH